MLCGVTAAVLGLDLITGTGAALVPLLVFLPAIVSGQGSVGQTAAASAWSVVMVGGAVVGMGGSPADNLGATVFTALFGLASVLWCRHRIRHEEEIHRLRSASAALQRQLVRPLPLRTPEVVVDGVYQPVEEDAMVGGDMYEVAASGHGTRVLIADVQGKGLRAIGAALALLGAFREAAYREATLEGVVESLESAVVRHNAFAADAGEPERFVTALVLGIGPRPEAEAVNCGHIPPYLIRAGRAVPVDLGEPAVPLGLGALAPGPRVAARFAFPPEAVLLLCTDGVTEARGGGGFYPLEARLRAWARDPAPGLAETVLADLQAFTGAAPRDDLAVLTLRRT